jgi:cytochrome c peroxidase
MRHSLNHEKKELNMKTANYYLAVLLAISAGAALAETPAGLMAGYAAEAVRATPGFTPSAERGQQLFTRKWAVSQTMPSCATCHSEQPAAEGKHVVTGKRIAPLAPAANPERFSSSAKVEKWFRRNCQEVVGRECSPAEKADFIQFVSKGAKS